MPFDPMLAARVEKILQGENGVTSRKMFGGFCFMIHGNMCCGIEKDRLILRVGTDLYESLLENEYVRPFDFTGKPLKGIVYVIPRGIQRDDDLRSWIDRALDFVRTLPHK